MIKINTRMYILLCFFVIFFLNFSTRIFAAPKKGTVVAGQASITQQAKKTTVQQTTNKAIIDWKSFDVGSNEWVAFMQPGSDSITLNRVTGNNRSDIFGKITAPGQVWLINRAGIFFGKNAYIDVAGLIATTADIVNNDFMAGRYLFTQPQGFDSSKIIHQGEINAGKLLNGSTVKENGLVALVAPGVENSGLIQANLGKVTLASVGGGEQFTIDLFGDNLITYVFSPNVVNPSYSVKNTGQIIANGGKVVLTAGAAKDIVDSVVSNTGIIEANAIGQHKGEIILYSGEHGLTSVSGQIKASGGTIKVLGNQIEVAKENPAVIDVSAQGGGGEILIGGAYQGKGETPTAMTTYVGPDGKILANAVLEGDGGSIIIWGNNDTYVFGTLEAKGGINGGAGGFIETSGKNLHVNGISVNTSAQPGWETGVWLLDPYNLYIVSDLVTAHVTSPPPAYEPDGTGLARLYFITLQNALNSSDVIVRTTAGSGTQPGNIYVEAPITWTSSNSLTLDAYNNLYINQPITGTEGTLILRAGLSIVPGLSGLYGAINVNNFILEQGNWYQIDPSRPNFIVRNNFQIYPGASFVRADAGDGITSPYEIYDIYGLQGIASTGLLEDAFSLVEDIDADVTENWNSGSGFNPIGSITSEFSGIIYGNQHVITDLYIDRPGEDDIGLFGYLNQGIIQDVGLQNPSILGENNVGALVGRIQDGSVERSWVVDGNIWGQINVGGLAGLVISNTLDSTISNSFSTANVNGNQRIGGLVGVLNKLGSNQVKIDKSYAAGIVIGNNFTGGILGYNQNGTVTSSFWDRNITGQSTSAGSTSDFGKNTFEMLFPGIFENAGWAFPPWNIEDGISYPYLGAIIPRPSKELQILAGIDLYNTILGEQANMYIAYVLPSFIYYFKPLIWLLRAKGFDAYDIEGIFKILWDLTRRVSFDDLYTNLSGNDPLGFMLEEGNLSVSQQFELGEIIDWSTQRNRLNDLVEFFQSLTFSEGELNYIYNVFKSASWTDIQGFVRSTSPT